MAAKIYIGHRGPQGVIVTVNGRQLDWRRDLYYHSPSGFEFGYRGSAPAQLALAILADHFGAGVPALAAHQDFKSDVISKLRGDSFTLTTDQIEDHLLSIQRERMVAARGTGADPAAT